MSDRDIDDAIYFLKRAKSLPEAERMDEIENAQLAILDAIRGDS